MVLQLFEIVDRPHVLSVLTKHSADCVQTRTMATAADGNASGLVRKLLEPWTKFELQAKLLHVDPHSTSLSRGTKPDLIKKLVGCGRTAISSCWLRTSSLPLVQLSRVVVPPAILAEVAGPCIYAC